MIRFVINWAPHPPGSDRDVVQTKALKEFKRQAPDWCQVHVCVLPGEPIPNHHRVSVLPRDCYWTFPTGRHLPYVKDVLDDAMSGLDERDWGGLLNSDVFITPRLCAGLHDLRVRHEVLTIHRTELKRWGDDPSSGLRWGRRKSLEGILLRAGVWWQLRDTCPDFILSEPYWDTGMIVWAETQGLDVAWTHDVLHVRHARSWKFGTPGAEHNRKLKEAL